ncbi:HhH-GPD family protein [Mucilaginibacter limnophilus]|uniref:hypothetical protein n=1 Tax=Mucilaginibacter limnophilus TaxID=1932778 RepID=UPI0013E3FF9A|nr:hypothetical protein [Mucilaginibacter limnophilus]
MEERIRLFREKILAWFANHKRVFPWRQDNLSPYELIIAEILLQRTKAETVSTFYTQFLAEFPNWQALVNADSITIENYLIPIGLYRQRAQRLKKLAIYLVDNNGVLPLDRTELENVPFMGQYIANAVELLVFNKRKPLLDVNMARVLERYFGPRKLSDIRYDPYLQQLAKDFVDHPDSKFLNWAILDFAALVCKARKPSCLSCLLNSTCKFFSDVVQIHDAGIHFE